MGVGSIEELTVRGGGSLEREEDEMI